MKKLIQFMLITLVMVARPACILSQQECSGPDDCLNPMIQVIADSRQIKERLRKGKTPPATARNLLAEQLAAIEEVYEVLNAAGDPWSAPGNATDTLKLRATQDITVATIDFVKTLDTSARFRKLAEKFPDKIQQYIFKHILGNDVATEDLEQEIRVMLKDYGQGMFSRWRGAEKNAGQGNAEPDGGNVPSYVFIIVIEALRTDHLGYNGYERDTTPFIDSLAAEGIVFENAFAQAPVTSISVASLFTAMYPNTHGMTSTAGWNSELNLADHIKKSGYTTAAFSANALVSPQWKYDFGFDHFSTLDMARADVVLDETARWLDKAALNKKRIFTYIHLFEPHDIYMAPEPVFGTFDSGNKFRTLAGVIKYELYHAEDPCDFDPMTENWDRPDLVFECLKKSKYLPKDTGPADVRNMIDRYDEEILFADMQLKRFFEYLERRNMLENSLVVLLSDHGESFMEHNQFLHSGVLYDNEIHVPLIIWRGENNFNGVRDKRLIELIDVLPTTMALAEIEPPESKLHGRNMMSENTTAVKQTTYSMTTFYPTDTPNNLLISVRTKQHKLIHRFFDNKTELYDLITDPAEMKNICLEETQTCEELKNAALKWNQQTKPATEKEQSPENKQKQKDLDQKLKDLGYLK